MTQVPGRMNLPQGVEAESLLGAAQAAQIALARRSFPFYCEFVHNRPLSRHHLVWVGRLMARPPKHTLIIAPPETWKSSVLRMFLEWRIGHNTEERCLLVMNTATQAKLQVASIAETISNNPRFRMVFPGVAPDAERGWTHDTLFIKRPVSTLPDPTLFGTGIDGPYQGGHYSIILIDDPTDPQDIKSQSVMDGQRQRIRGVLMDRLVEGGQIFAILTRWGEGDLVKDFTGIGFEVIEMPIEGKYPWGRLLWPEVFDDIRLADLRRAKGGDLFDLTYMCNTASVLGAVLRREWWRFYNELPENEKVLSTTLVWDVALTTGEMSDYSVCGVWRVTEAGYYLVNVMRERLETPSLIAKTKLLYETWRPTDPVLVEESTASLSFIQMLRRQTNIPILGIKVTGRDKVARVRAVVPMVEAGRVYIKAGQPWTDGFISECASFPSGEHDDQVDMLSMALEYLPRQTPAEGLHGYRKVFVKR